MIKTVGIDIKVADEVFIATALLHREHPEREDFTVSEIVDRAAQENIFGAQRPGVRIHAYLHCVANRPPNPANYRMLYAIDDRRRLLRAHDKVDPRRTGKIWPEAEKVPPQYRELIDWAKKRYGDQQHADSPWLGSILEMRGMGRTLWAGEDPDEYVRRLREGWV